MAEFDKAALLHAIDRLHADCVALNYRIRAQALENKRRSPTAEERERRMKELLEELRRRREEENGDGVSDKG